jgi:hypothetical protein
MPDEIVVTNEELKILDKKFEKLRERANSGEYIVEAQQEGEEKFIGAGEIYRTSNYSDTSLLTVTIKPSEENLAAKPSEENLAASFREMTFTYQHYRRLETGCSRSTESGSVVTGFRIEAADGNVFTYGPEERAFPELLSALLANVRELGLRKIQAEKTAAYLAEPQAPRSEESPRTAAFRNLGM